MSITLPDARQVSDEALQTLRGRAVRGIDRGFSETELANRLGVSRETISRWGSAYASAGLDALPQDRTRTPPRLGPLEVTAWVEAHKGYIELFYLPRYSPEMNPVEYRNNDLKGAVNEAGLPDDRETLHGRILDFMNRLVHLPKHVISYFLHPCVQYAAPIEL